jgi:extracellular matrix protein 14
VRLDSKSRFHSWAHDHLHLHSSFSTIRIHALLTMQLQHNALSLLPVCVILVICAPFQAIAAPWSGSDNVKASSQFATPQRQHPSVEQPRSFWSGLPQLKFLRNAFTRTGHQLPQSATKDVIAKPVTKPSNTKLPSRLLAHYNKDVVLRFNLSTPYEEQMLADAADHLLLDVWEFTNNWADIRLSEDVVRSANPSQRSII